MTDTAPSSSPSDVLAAEPPAGPALRPVPRRRRRSAARRSARRVVRRIEPMSVLKVSALFYACAFVVLLVAGVALWLVASAAGVIGNVETFIGDLFALDDFHFEALQILLAAFVGGAVLVLVGTALNVVAATLFNRIAEVVGGVEVTIADDEPASSGPRTVV